MGAVVLITGASTGFGRNAAERLARRGHHVFATMRDIEGRNAEHRDALERLAARESLPLRVLELDVTDDRSVQSAVQGTLREAGQLDVVINNAGVAGIGVTEAFTLEQVQAIFDVNFFSVVRVNRAALPSMRQRRSGLLVHVSSGAGRVVVPGFGAYCASKFAMEALADAYRFELLPLGIDSVLVEPGIYNTPIFDRLVGAADGECETSYGTAAAFVDDVRGTFRAVTSAPDAPGSDEVAEALVRLVEMPPSARPFRTVVSPSMEQLLASYNAAAEALRPIVARIFNVPALAGVPPVDSAAASHTDMMPGLDLQPLRATFQGGLVTPEHAGYNDACRLWNASINKRPALIARCTGIADIVSAVNFARENSLLTAVRGGGHNVGGRALCDDGIVIDLSQMRAVHVDPATRTVRVQGGATLGDLDRETHAFGLAVPCGVVPKTGIGGLTLGGGVGWLVRKYGMTIDNLLSCQVVTADGTVRTASDSENADLFWALRGGGGNFGVVASFQFQAHPVRTVLGGLLLYPREAAVEVIGHFRDFIESAPEELTAYAALLHGPDGAPLVGVIPCYCGEIAEGQRILEPLRKFGTPAVDTIQELPFPAMQALLAPSFPDGNHNYWKSTLQRDLSDDAIDAVVDHANRMSSPLSAIVIEYYAGAAARVPSHATAFPHRDLPWDILFIAQWSEPPETMTHREWARAGEEGLRRFSANAHLLSALDLEPDDVIDSAFGANRPRLAAIKAKYDSANFFRVNHNIKPGLTPA